MGKWILGIAVLISASFATSSFADILYSPDYTCAQLQQIVAQQGEAEIQMPFGYGVYVSSPDRCQGFGSTAGEGIVFGTKDAATCNVGYVCSPNWGGGGANS